MSESKVETDTSGTLASGLLLLVFAVVMGLFGGHRIAAKLSAKSWKQVAAQFVSGEIYSRTNRGTDWCMKIKYRYSVDDQVYESDKLVASLVSDEGCDVNKATVQAHLDRYRFSGIFFAYYDDLEHGRAVLIKEDFDFLDYFMLVIVLFLTITSVFYIVKSFQFVKKSSWAR